MLLQCRASFLPPIDFNQRDSRIKAVIAINPVTSTALGPESMGKIDIPTMMLGGSKDIAAPFVMEQAHPFLWLKTQNKYLGLMAGGTHGYEDNRRTNSSSGLFANPSPKLRRSYLKAMSLAFFESYLGDSQSDKPNGQGVSPERRKTIGEATASRASLRTTNYQVYLNPAYAQYISDRKLPLHLIESLTPEQPLTCNFYGLILPKGQSKWKSLVNDFIASKNREIQSQWFQDYSAQTLSDADYCLNRLTK